MVAQPAVTPLLAVRDLVLAAQTSEGEVRLVDGVSFDVAPGEIVALVGESGSGKTLTARSLLGLLPPEVRVAAGSIRLEGVDLAGRTERELEAIRGRRISLVLQDAMEALNPVLSIGRQVTEVLEHHGGLGRRAARERALELLEQVGLQASPELLDQYPHQLSGGMRQRVLLAQALAGGPQLLIADEPTTALDMHLRTQILALLAHLRRAHGLAVLLITHDLGAVAGLADRVLVMYGGRVMEAGLAPALLTHPAHPYTRALLAAVPRLEGGPDRLQAVEGQPPELTAAPSGCPFHPRCPRTEKVCRLQRPPVGSAGGPGHLVACWLPGPDSQVSSQGALHGGLSPLRIPGSSPRPEAGGVTVLQVSGLVKHFRLGGLLDRRVVRAVDGVSFALRDGEALALVGESGSGKTTLGRTILRLHRPDAGELHFLGREIGSLGEAALVPLRRQMATVFQNPAGSLNPRLSVAELVAEPLRTVGRQGAAVQERVGHLLSLVGLGREHLDRLPHQLSGGQRQRVGIARALALEPRLLVADEPVSALDVSVQAQVINLLGDLKEQLGLSYLFITHDLALCRYLTDRVAVLYRGKIVEVGPTSTVMRTPAHPYTRSLVQAARLLDAASEPGSLPVFAPRAAGATGGCPFRPHCPMARAACAAGEPGLTPIGPGHEVACHTFHDAMSS